MSPERSLSAYTLVRYLTDSDEPVLWEIVHTPTPVLMQVKTWDIIKYRKWLSMCVISQKLTFSIIFQFLRHRRPRLVKNGKWIIEAPTQWDWREAMKVSKVQNQGAMGSSAKGSKWKVDWLSTCIRSVFRTSISYIHSCWPNQQCPCYWNQHQTNWSVSQANCRLL